MCRQGTLKLIWEQPHHPCYPHLLGLPQPLPLPHPLPPPPFLQCPAQEVQRRHQALPGPLRHPPPPPTPLSVCARAPPNPTPAAGKAGPPPPPPPPPPGGKAGTPLPPPPPPGGASARPPLPQGSAICVNNSQVSSFHVSSNVIAVLMVSTMCKRFFIKKGLPV